MNLPVGSAHGYPFDSYGSTGIAPPIHHLGFGVYFTTMKAIAKKYAGNTMRGMKTFYLDTHNIEKINFGSPNTMMRWWIQNGYNMTPEATKAHDMKTWIEATQNLTNTLASRYDAVWFLGKGIYKLLDGDQICVYRPELIRLIDPKMSSGLEVGAKIVATGVFPSRFKGSNDLYMDDLKPNDYGLSGKLGSLGQGWKGIFRASDEERPLNPNSMFAHMGMTRAPRSPIHIVPPAGTVGIIMGHPFDRPGETYSGRNDLYNIKWTRGGVMYNYQPEEIQPFIPKNKTRASS
jgi:hypothetical protein